MSPGQIIAAIVIAGAGYWLITGQNPLSLFGINTSGIDRYIDPRVSAASQTLASQIAQAEQMSAQGSTRVAIGSTVGAAGTGAAIAAKAGIVGSTALLATGIAAAGALLFWGISQKGWFRGGEEGIRVNPARDQFLDTWVQNYYPGTPINATITDPVTGVTSTAQYNAMVRAFHDAGIRGDIAEQTIAQLYRADTMQEFQVAAEHMLAVLQSGVKAA